MGGNVKLRWREVESPSAETVTVTNNFGHVLTHWILEYQEAPSAEDLLSDRVWLSVPIHWMGE